MSRAGVGILLALIVLSSQSCSTMVNAAKRPVAADHAEPVILVHGIFDTAIATRPMRERLEREGYRCIAPTLSPSDASTGIEDLAGKLRDAIDREIGDHGKFSIVAFSMGGIVSRYYLQELGGHERCRALYTVSSPHNGTLLGFLYPTKGARQMRPKSEFLCTLNDDTSKLAEMEVVSYRTPLDTMIIPSKSSKWELADNVVVWSLAHPLMLFNRRLQKDVVQRLDSQEAEPGLLK